MSRGPGKIQTTIRRLMDERPDWAWTVEDLCDEVYDIDDEPEKKHRVAVLRVINRIAETDPDWRLSESHQTGGTRILFNAANVHSRALAYGKSSNIHNSQARRQGCWPQDDAAAVAARLDPSEECRRHTALHIAKRDGDTDTYAALKKEQDAANQAYAKALRSIVGK